MVNTTPIYQRPVNTTGFNDFFFTYADTVLFNGLWGEMLLLMVFTISFVSMLQFGTRRPLAAASFITWVSAVFLRIIGPVGDLLVTITTVLLLVAVLLNRGDQTTI